MSRTTGSWSRKRKRITDGPDPLFSWTTPRSTPLTFLVRLRKGVGQVHLTAHLPHLPPARSGPFALISLSSGLPLDIATLSNEAQNETNYSEMTKIRETQEKSWTKYEKMENERTSKRKRTLAQTLAPVFVSSFISCGISVEVVDFPLICVEAAT